MSNILTTSVIGPIIKSCTTRVYSKGQIILYPKDDSSYLYLIKSGAVTMHDIDETGNRKILHIFGPPTLFPMVSFSGDRALSSWFYTALVDTEMYVIPYSELKRRFREIDGVSAYNLLLQQVLEEVHELLVRINSQTKTDSNSKLIAALLFFLDHHTKAASTTWYPIVFPVTHQLLADMTGLTRETVSLAMKELTKKRIARYITKGNLELHSKNLRRYAM